MEPDEQKDETNVAEVNKQFNVEDDMKVEIEEPKKEMDLAKVEKAELDSVQDEDRSEDLPQRYPKENVQKRKAPQLKSCPSNKKAKLIGPINEQFFDIYYKIDSDQLRSFFGKHGIQNIVIFEDRNGIMLKFGKMHECKRAWDLSNEELKKRRPFGLSKHASSESGRSSPTAIKVPITESKIKRFFPWEIDFWVSDPKSTYGLSKEFLASMDIKLPLSKYIHVENLVCKEAKARDLFQRAGKVVFCKLEEGNYYIMYSHPIESVQAISLFNNQKYLEKELRVKMCDSFIDDVPEHMESIGPGFGVDGAALPDVARQMKRCFKGRTSNVNERILATYPNYEDESDDNVDDENHHIETPNESPNSNGNSEDNSDLAEKDKSQDTVEKTIQTVQNEDAGNREKNALEVFPEKALVPERVAKKIVEMIKKGWTTDEIVVVLDSADCQKVKPASLGNLSRFGSPLNHLTTAAQTDRVTGPLWARPIGPAGPNSHGNPGPIAGNTNPMLGPSVPNPQTNPFLGMNRQFRNSSQSPNSGSVGPKGSMGNFSRPNWQVWGPIVPAGLGPETFGGNSSASGSWWGPKADSIRWLEPTESGNPPGTTVKLENTTVKVDFEAEETNSLKEETIEESASVKCHSDMDKEQFNTKLQKYFDSHNENSKKSEWTNEKVNSVMNIIASYNRAKAQGKRANATEYYHAKKYHILTVGGEKALILKGSLNQTR